MPRAAKRRTSGKTVEQLKAEMTAKEAAKATKTVEASEASLHLPDLTELTAEISKVEDAVVSPKSKRRTFEERRAAIEEAKRLLDLGMRKAFIVGTLQNKFDISRRSSYEDFDQAMDEMRLEDFGIERDDLLDSIDPASLLASFGQMFIKAYSDGDVDRCCKISKEIERVKKQMGKVVTMSTRSQSEPEG